MIAHVFPAPGPLTGDIEPPSSKNYTTRMILASALAEGFSIVHRPAIQDDAVALVRCIGELGAKTRALTKSGEVVEFAVENATTIDRLEITGFGSAPKLQEGIAAVDPDNAGAVLRLLLGVGAVMEGPVRFETKKYPDSLGVRPNLDLVDSFEQMGVRVDKETENASLPLVLHGGRDRIATALAEVRLREGLGPDEPAPIRISGSVSSQFVSSLLFLAPLLPSPTRIEVVEGLKSRPLIKTTLQVLKGAEIDVEYDEEKIWNGLPTFTFQGNQQYKAKEWTVSGDWPGSAAILGAAAAIPGSSIRVKHLVDDEQGEKRCLEFYGDLGCKYDSIRGESFDGVIFNSPDQLKGNASIDGDTCTDAVLAMMGTAATVPDPDSVCQFFDISNLQFKECDRVREPIAEMNKAAGFEIAGWEPFDSPETISVKGASGLFDAAIEVDGRGDHRVIMLLSIMALRSQKGLRIKRAEHVAKSFPGWFDTLKQMGVRVEFD